REMREEIELWRKQFRVGEPGQKLPDALDVETYDHTEHEADNGADYSDGGARDQEHAHDRTLGRANRAQDGDVLPLVLHQHDQAGDDIKCSDQNDERQDQEHHVALNLQRIEERRVALPPVDHENRPLRGVLYRLAIAVDPVGIVRVDLDGCDVTYTIEIGLSLLERHEHHGVVVFRHADLKYSGDLVDLDARCRSHRRHRAARRHQRNVVARSQ